VLVGSGGATGSVAGGSEVAVLGAEVVGCGAVAVGCCSVAVAEAAGCRDAVADGTAVFVAAAGVLVGTRVLVAVEVGGAG
jgi:hypothetical protein